MNTYTKPDLSQTVEWPPEKPILRSYSQYGEDCLIFHFFYMHTKIENGTYLDIGAFDPVKYSNTFLLHKHGWSGINIDVAPSRIAQFRIARPNDHNVLCAIGDTDGELQIFDHPHWPTSTTVDKAVAARTGATPGGVVASRRLGPLLEELSVDHIDYVNIDVEGFEMKVLTGFEPNDYGVSLFTIELLTQDINTILNSRLYAYMRDRGYGLCGWTGWTLFFRSASLEV